MPPASWKGFLPLSLVSCPVYLSPAGPLLFGLAERAEIPLRSGYRRCSVTRIARGDVLTDMASRMAPGCPSR
jgi:non-homologous end joining protein Ku